MKKITTILALALILLFACCLSASADCTHTATDGTSLAFWQVTIPPTCTNVGVKSLVCANCTNVLQVATIPTIAHEYGDYTETVAAGCTSSGIETATCKNCGIATLARATAPLGHDLTTTPAVAATCTTAGTTAITTCSRCTYKVGGETIPKIAHKFDTNPSAYTAATCTANGSKEYSCIYGCGETTTELIPALGHDFPKTWTVESAATCTTAGVETRQCLRCGTEKQSRSTALIAHTYTDETIAVAATCTTDGVKKITCNQCNTAYKTEKIPATGHKYPSTWTTVTAATCQAEGKEERVCQNCTDKQTRTVKKTAHEYTVELSVEKPATCTEAGSHTMKCANCTATKKETIAKLGHDFSGTPVVVAATCETDGSKTWTCSRCTATKVEKIAKLNHPGTWVVVTPATEKANGLAEKVCTECGNKFTKVLVYTIYNGTMCSYGPCTRDLIGGGDWYRVTPIDLSYEHSEDYPLIAGNKYKVGSLSVIVKNGTLTISYRITAPAQVTINSENIYLYNSLDALRSPNGSNTCLATRDQPIDIAATFGNDTKILLSLVAKIDYEPINLPEFQENALDMTVMKSIID